MAFANQLITLRKQCGLSQEQLGTEIGVSRQTVSKWELGNTTPELDKLVALSDYFDISLDDLVGRDTVEHSFGPSSIPQPHQERFIGQWHYEYKSQRSLWGLPLVHINLCHRGHCRARGVLAIGNVASGLFALGGAATGLISFGGGAVGLIAIGGGAVGLLSLAGIAAGIFSLGGISVGYLACGGVAVGVYAIGGVAVAAKVAVAEYANAPYVIDPGFFRSLALETSRKHLSEFQSAWQQEHMLQMLAQFPKMPRWIALLLSWLGTH